MDNIKTTVMDAPQVKTMQVAMRDDYRRLISGLAQMDDKTVSELWIDAAKYYLIKRGMLDEDGNRIEPLRSEK